MFGVFLQQDIKDNKYSYALQKNHHELSQRIYY